MTGVQLTEAQRRRVQATEQKPLTEQLSRYAQQLGKETTAETLEGTDVTSKVEQLKTMLGLAGQTQEQKIAAAKAPLEMSEALLPTLAELAQYQSPSEKLAQQIASEKLMKQLGLGGYATETAKYETIGNADSGFYSFDPTTGAIKQLTQPTGGTVWSTPSVDKLTGKITQTNLKTGEMKVIGEVGTAEGGLSDMSANILYNINTLLSSDLSRITGLSGVAKPLYGDDKTLYALKEQLVNQLAVNARAYIKGQGQISDKETEMLEKSATILKTKTLSKEATTTELKRIQGIIRSSAGEMVDVQVLKDGKAVDEGLLGREDIYSALQQGYQIIYK
jgi:hypothetical protein